MIWSKYNPVVKDSQKALKDAQILRLKRKDRSLNRNTPWNLNLERP
jgi:hypothetical protein